MSHIIGYDGDEKIKDMNLCIDNYNSGIEACSFTLEVDEEKLYKSIWKHHLWPHGRVTQKDKDEASLVSKAIASCPEKWIRLRKES